MHLSVRCGLLVATLGAGNQEGCCRLDTTRHAASSREPSRGRHWRGRHWRDLAPTLGTADDKDTSVPDDFSARQ